LLVLLLPESQAWYKMRGGGGGGVVKGD